MLVKRAFVIWDGLPVVQPVERKVLIADGDVKVTIRPEVQIAAVVIDGGSS